MLDGGHISDVGTHDELLVRSDIYRETFTSQNKMTEEQAAVVEQTERTADATQAASTGAGAGVATVMNADADQGVDATAQSADTNAAQSISTNAVPAADAGQTDGTATDDSATKGGEAHE